MVCLLLHLAHKGTQADCDALTIAHSQLETSMNAVADTASPYHTATPVVTASTLANDAVSWAAVFAGAAVAAAMSLILLLLGTGFGLSSVSPWSFEGVSAETFGWTAIAWISFTSLIASGLGGYISGRLRTRWASLHSDEAFFRDTAHGLLAWCVATLFTAALLTSTIAAILSTGAKAGAAATVGLAQTAVVAGAASAGVAATRVDEARDTDEISYFVDSMLRPAAPPSTVAAPAPVSADAAADLTTAPTPSRVEPVSPPIRAEALLIVSNSLRTDSLSAADTRYLGRLVAERSGLTQQEAEARVTETRVRLQAALDEASNTAKSAAEEARKAAAYTSLWLFITLLMGAFAASLMATFGGRQRDL